MVKEFTSYAHQHDRSRSLWSVRRRLWSVRGWRGRGRLDPAGV